MPPPPELALEGDRPPATLADRVENAVSIALLVGMAVLPILEIVGRRVWRTGIPGSGTLVQHATLWIGLLGGAISARDDRLLSIWHLADRFSPDSSPRSPPPSPSCSPDPVSSWSGRSGPTAIT